MHEYNINMFEACKLNCGNSHTFKSNDFSWSFKKVCSEMLWT